MNRRYRRDCRVTREDVCVRLDWLYEINNLIQSSRRRDFNLGLLKLNILLRHASGSDTHLQMVQSTGFDAHGRLPAPEQIHIWETYALTADPRLGDIYDRLVAHQHRPRLLEYAKHRLQRHIDVLAIENPPVSSTAPNLPAVAERVDDVSWFSCLRDLFAPPHVPFISATDADPVAASAAAREAMSARFPAQRGEYGGTERSTYSDDEDSSSSDDDAWSWCSSFTAAAEQVCERDDAAMGSARAAEIETWLSRRPLGPREACVLLADRVARELAELEQPSVYEDDEMVYEASPDVGSVVEVPPAYEKQPSQLRSSEWVSARQLGTVADVIDRAERQETMFEGPSGRR